MKALKVVLGAGLLIVLATVAGIAYVAVYLDNHRDLLEAGASQALGRQVEVQRGVSLAWSMRPRIALDGVSIANPAWAGGGYFARAERVEVNLDLWALFAGRIEVEQMTLQNADVALLTGTDGRANWTFGPAGQTGGGVRIDWLQVRDSSLHYQSAGGVEHRLDIARLELQGLGGDGYTLAAQVRYRDVPFKLSLTSVPGGGSGAPGWPVTGRAETRDATLEIAGRALAPLVLSGKDIEFDLKAQNLRSLQTLFQQQDLPEGPVRIAARLSVQDGAYRFQAIRGSIDLPGLIQDLTISGGDANLSTEGPVSVAVQGAWKTVPGTLAFGLGSTGAQDQGDDHQLDLKATLGGIELASQGQLRGSPTGLRWDLDVDLRAADLTGIDPILGGGWRPGTPAAVTARVEKSGQGYSFAGLAARFGASEFNGDLQLTLDGPRPRIEGDLVAKQLDMDAFAAGAQPSAANAAQPNWRDIPLPMAPLDALDVTLGLRAQDVRAGGLRADELRTRILLKDGRLQLDSMDASLPGLRVAGTATLDTRAQPPALDLALRSDRVDLPQALHALLPSLRIVGSLRQVDARLKTVGLTPGELIGNADGALEAGSAHLSVPAGEGAEAKELTLTKARIDAGPKKPVRLRTGLSLAGRTLTLDATGGTLADLLRDDKAWRTIEVAARTEIAEKPLEIQGHVGPWSALVAGRDLGVDLTARHHGLTAQLRGTLERLERFPGRGLSLRVSGPSLARMSPVLGTELPESEPFEIAARLEEDDDSLSLKEIDATLGETDLAGEARIVPGPKLRVEARLDTRLLDLTPYWPAGGSASNDAPTILAHDLPLDLLHGLDGLLSLRADLLRIGDTGVRDIDLGASLEAGHLSVRMNAGDGRLAGDVDLRPEGRLWRLTLNQKGKYDLAWLTDDKRGDRASNAPVAFDARLSGVGRSVKALLATADGRLDMDIGTGRVNNKVPVLPLSGILVTLLDTVGPSTKDEQTTNLQCAVIRLDVAAGIATSSDGIAVRTDELNVLGTGTLNLGTGDIDFQFRAAQRSGLGISALGIADRLIRITGTPWQPQVAADPKGLLIFGGGALATGGATLLLDNLFKRLASSGDICDAVRKQTRE